MRVTCTTCRHILRADDEGLFHHVRRTGCQCPCQGSPGADFGYEIIQDQPPTAEAGPERVSIELEVPHPPAPAPALPDGRLISNSELRTFKRCRRKWWFTYYRQLRLRQPEVTGPRALGTRIHVALAAYYSTRPDDPIEVLEKAIAEDRALLGETGDVRGFDNDADLARAMLEGYLSWARDTGADDGLRTIADEATVTAPLREMDTTIGKPVHLIGKLDVRVERERDGSRLFLDHKTVQDLTAPTMTLHIDEQMLMYHLIERLNNEAPCDGGLYNMLRKVKRTPRSMPPFYDRVEVRHNVTELRNFWARIQGVVNDVLTVERGLDDGGDPMTVAYPTPQSTCYWDCEFFPVCPMHDDGSRAEDMLTAMYAPTNPLARYDQSA